MLTHEHFGIFGKGIYMLLILVLMILLAEKVGEQGGKKVRRKAVAVIGVAGAILAIAVNGILIFDATRALWILRFDLIFFPLFPPFCFGLWEKSL